MEIRGDDEVKELNTLTLYCTVQARPMPVITWLKRSGEAVTVILKNTRTSITTQYMSADVTATSTLAINRAVSSDQGEYACEAKNDFNMTTNTAVAIKTVGISGMYIASYVGTCTRLNKS